MMDMHIVRGAADMLERAKLSLHHVIFSNVQIEEDVIHQAKGERPYVRFQTDVQRFYGREHMRLNPDSAWRVACLGARSFSALLNIAP